MVPDTIRVALIVAEALEACHVRYLVGGSLASGVSGEPRSTLDVDLVVELTEKDIGALGAALGERFHFDAEAARRAVRERSSTNLIHYETSIKIDLFIAGRSAFDKEQMDRRQRVQMTTGSDAWIYVYTPEDILLKKLEWYRMGNEISERQWRDVLGIILVQQDRLDNVYLERGARNLGVSDLLERAMGRAQDE